MEIAAARENFCNVPDSLIFVIKKHAKGFELDFFAVTKYLRLKLELVKIIADLWLES